MFANPLILNKALSVARNKLEHAWFQNPGQQTRFPTIQ